MASQPTIGTESGERLHGLHSQIPTPKYMTNDGDGTNKDLNSNDNMKREGTRLLIMSESTEW